MQTNLPRIFFLGSGSLAIPILARLAKSRRLQFLGGATGISRPGKRGKLSPTPVNAAAELTGVTLEEVANVNAPEFLEKLAALRPDLILLVSFGQLLKSEILSLPRCGCVNIHPSPLPRYRGASPVVQTILQREPATDICFMQMETGLDSGPVYARIPVKLTGDEYADELERALAELAADHLDDILTDIAAGTLAPIAQSGESTYCTKIAKAAGEIDWRRDAADIFAQIRAYHPWPGAFSWEVTGNAPCRLTINRAKLRPELSAEPGKTVAGESKALCVGCGSGGALELTEVVPQGGKPMSGIGFRNGRRGASLQFSAGEILPDGSPNLQGKNS